MLEQSSYRVSSYMIDVKLDNADQYVLLHGYTGAIDVVDATIVASLKKMTSFFQINDLPLPADVKELLIKRGYVTSLSSEEEYEYVKKMSSLLHKRDALIYKNFTFVVTYNCNFRCPYCFEKGRDDIGTSFTKEMIDKTYDAILRIEPNSKLRSSVIVLFGGEPLLKENLSIVDYIVKKGNLLGFKFYAVTNGYDLENYKSLLSSDKIFKIQVTIDGIKSFHDKRRIHYKGFPTFDKIVSNIGLALDQGISVVVRVNTDKNNINQLGELIELFEQCGYTKNEKFAVESALLKNYNGDTDNGKLKFFTQKEFLKQHKDLNLPYPCQNYEVYHNIYNAITKHTPLSFKSNFCRSQINGFVFDPYGRIFPCWEIVGDARYQIGKLCDLNGEIEWNEKVLNHWRHYNVSESPICGKCKYALFCGGGCFAINQKQFHCKNMESIFNYAVNKAILDAGHKYV